MRCWTPGLHPTLPVSSNPPTPCKDNALCRQSQTELQPRSLSHLLLIGFDVALVEFRFLLLLTDNTQRLFEKPRGLLAVSALESDSVNLDFAGCADDDFDDLHIAAPMRMSLM